MPLHRKRVRRHAASPGRVAGWEARRADHRHNLLEVVFLGRSERRDADHQLAFEWGDQLPDEESPWVLQANGEAAGVGVLAPVPPAPVALAVPDPFSGSVAWRGPPPPWRGLVMRV